MKFPPREIELAGGARVTLREADAPDARAFLDYRRDEVATSPFVLTVPEDPTRTPDEQEALIRAWRADPRSLLMLAWIDDRLIGASSLIAGDRFKCRHSSDFGTTVAAAWRGRGLGRAMLDTMLRWARENPEILRVTLDVMAPNAVARRMYIEAGFREIGVQRRAYRQPDGAFVDGVPMELWVG